MDLLNVSGIIPGNKQKYLDYENSPQDFDYSIQLNSGDDSESSSESEFIWKYI